MRLGLSARADRGGKSRRKALNSCNKGNVHSCRISYFDLPIQLGQLTVLLGCKGILDDGSESVAQLYFSTAKTGK